MSQDGSKINALFFTEFDNKKGRTLAFQEPYDAISEDFFDALSDYLIPKPQLCGQLVTVRIREKLVLCWPVCLTHVRYERNALMFSLGFLLDAAETSEHDACARFGPLLHKASAHLAAMELESAAVAEQAQQVDASDASAPTDPRYLLRSRLDVSARGELAHLLPQMLQGLQVRGECMVAADAANTIHLRLPPPPQAGTARGAPTGEHHWKAIDKEQVPLLLATPDPQFTLRYWDLTLQKLLRFLDGTRTVAAIANAARAELSLVRQGLFALQSAGWVRLVDAFAIDDVYGCNPSIHALANDPEARERLRRAVSHAERSSKEATGHDDSAGGGAANAATWPDVLRLYGACQPGPSGWRTLRDVCKLHPESAARVDLRALVYVGLLNNLLHKVQQW